MQKITPHLWFDQEAREAAEFYVSVFKDSEVTNITTIHDTPSGDCDIVSFNLLGQPFMAISAGSLFKINPSVSFLVNFDPSRDKDVRQKLDEAWKKLSDEGTELMPLDKYPFSEHYGWIQDKYGVSWQLILTDPKGDPRPAIVPFLMFVGENAGKAEETINFYLSVFKNSKQGTIVRHPAGTEPEIEGTIMFADFMIEGTWLAALDSAREYNFTFNEAISLMVSCDTQEEINYYWKKLSAVPESEQCGWVKDKYGLSWQIVPKVLGELMSSSNQEKVDRVTQAMLNMKKLDIEKLKAAA
jgi:predicted 3-demethylubiquinone-9 3-methyltransferase (glyoxalase superfamily)